MIRLENVTLTYPSGKTVFRDLSLTLPTDRRLAVLGRTESGKTSLINLLAGTDDVTSGRIERYARLSFPAGFQRGFRMANTGRQNAMFAAKIYNADPEEVFRFVAAVSKLGPMMERPMREWSAQARIMFAYLLTYTLPFDTYVFDNVLGPNTPEMREVWIRLFEARTRTGGAILATRQPRTAEQFCDCALVMLASGPVFFDDIRDGLAAFRDEPAPAVAPAATAPAPAPVVAEPGN